MARNTKTSHISAKDAGKLFAIEDKRDRLLFAAGLWLGLRATSELCRLKWKDLLNVETVKVWQPKTSKFREVAMPLALKPVVNECYEGQDPDSYIFTGRRGQDGTKPLSNKAVNDLIRKYFSEFGIKTRLNSSSHCLRKTWGRCYLDANGCDIDTLSFLQNNFGHSSIAITMTYLSIDFERQAQMVNNIKYG